MITSIFIYIWYSYNNSKLPDSQKILMFANYLEEEEEEETDGSAKCSKIESTEVKRRMQMVDEGR